MNRTKKIALFFIVSAVMFFSLSFYSFYQVNSLVIDSNDRIHNSFIEDYDISNVEIEKIGYKLDEIEKNLTRKEVSLLINNKEYKYSLYEMGVRINKDDLIKNIKEFENNLDYWTLYNNFSKNSFDKQVYEYKYVLDDEKLNKFLESLKKRIEIAPKEGHLEMGADRVLKYVSEVVGYKLDVEKSKEIIKSSIGENDYSEEILIEGSNITIDNKYKVINTKYLALLLLLIILYQESII